MGAVTKTQLFCQCHVINFKIHFYFNLKGGGVCQMQTLLLIFDCKRPKYAVKGGGVKFCDVLDGPL